MLKYGIFSTAGLGWLKSGDDGRIAQAHRLGGIERARNFAIRFTSYEEAAIHRDASFVKGHVASLDGWLIVAWKE